MRTSLRTQGGFTLIEQVVVGSLFVVLVGILGGVYTAFVRQHRNQLSAQVIQSDLSVFFEVLDREVRTGFGSSFRVNADGTEFALRNQNGKCVKYGRDEGRVWRVQIDPPCTVDDVLADTDVTSGEPLTSQSTEFTRFLFTSVRTPVVDDGGTGDAADDFLTGAQGRVTVSLQACLRQPPNEHCVDVQTTITSRQYGPDPN